MPKKPIQPQDKFVLRLPEGLRDRIKAYAKSQGRSMNAEIVRLLEREFPAPKPIERRIGELLELVSVLKTGVSDAAVDAMTSQIEVTIQQILSGQITGIDSTSFSRLHQLWEHYQEELVEYAAVLDDLDEGESKTFGEFGSTAKVIDNDFLNRRESQFEHLLEPWPMFPDQHFLEELADRLKAGDVEGVLHDLTKFHTSHNRSENNS